MSRWLSYGSQHDSNPATQLLHRREFSFTTGDDVYIRYLSYEDAAALRKDLVNKLPHKIDIGAVFSAAPRDHKKYKLFEPLQREFIIDIDLTDYDFLDVDVKRLETCDRCWPLMALALRVLTTALREDFGFEQLLWVYSGRRGIHCWVCDTRARVMSNEVRSSVADYLGPKLNAATGRLSIPIPMHPTLKDAYETECKPFFYSHILASTESGGFGILDTEAGQTKLLDMLGDEQVKEHFLEQWAKSDESGRARWEKLERYAEKKSVKMPSVLVEIIFTYTYPRLDVNVSKGMNHLLKSPWCAHPKTGRVCVPLDPEMAAEFQPSEVPTLRMCAEELDAAKKEGAVLGQGKDISATRLHKYEAAFDAFLKRSENAIRAERVREKGEKGASLDF
jgi:DNA primase small subunit